ncbi:MAG TPA: ZIP family metal transporter [Candidatus Brocadiia bacterium]|nr:ZIP family metal transporter [Candidatus Brocadiia bacterium]
MTGAVVEFFKGMSPVAQALAGTLFTWFVTALGAGVVFFAKRFNQKLMDGMLGFAAGVMIAASYWSLLAPAIEMSGRDNGIVPPWMPEWFPATAGFLLGGAFLYAVDKLLPHLHLGLDTSQAEGIHTRWQRSVLLVLAITLHNIPEGMAVGVAFGAVKYNLPGAGLGVAIALALGIGLQNFPEGLAVAMPLRREGMTRTRAFFYGQASGIVEPIAGVIGAALVMSMRPILPYALAFAAGAMIYVVVEELVPESQRSGDTDLATMGAMLGFALMMAMDVGLG